MSNPNKNNLLPFPSIDTEAKISRSFDMYRQIINYYKSNQILIYNKTQTNKSKFCSDIVKNTSVTELLQLYKELLDIGATDQDEINKFHQNLEILFWAINKNSYIKNPFYLYSYTPKPLYVQDLSAYKDDLIRKREKPLTQKQVDEMLKFYGNNKKIAFPAVRIDLTNIEPLITIRDYKKYLLKTTLKFEGFLTFKQDGILNNITFNPNTYQLKVEQCCKNFIGGYTIDSKNGVNFYVGSKYTTENWDFEIKENLLKSSIKITTKSINAKIQDITIIGNIAISIEIERIPKDDPKYLEFLKEINWDYVTGIGYLAACVATYWVATNISIGTIVEDFVTCGIGTADDPISFYTAYQMALHANELASQGIQKFGY